jgi:sugar phosphate isomerase/epimerase
MITRRNFIKWTSAAALAGMVFPKNLLAFHKDKIIGIQLYTIRDLVNADLEGTLKMLNEVGYKSIEAAGYQNGQFYGLSPKEYKKLVLDNGLAPLSSHSRIDLKTVQNVIDDHCEAGMSYLVVPSIPVEQRKTVDGYLRQAEEFNKIGELCKKSGLTFGYHNHAFEFEPLDDKIPYRILLDNTDPEFVTMQLDTYWMVYGGSDPLAYFDEYPGRFKLWHIKDMDKSEARESTEIGDGIINFKKMFRHAPEAGLECYFVEQEEFKMDTVESIRRSFNYLNSI